MSETRDFLRSGYEPTMSELGAEGLAVPKP
jgi:hypothetical protein